MHLGPTVNGRSFALQHILAMLEASCVLRAARSWHESHSLIFLQAATIEHAPRSLTLITKKALQIAAIIAVRINLLKFVTHGRKYSKVYRRPKRKPAIADGPPTRSALSALFSGKGSRSMRSWGWQYPILPLGLNEKDFSSLLNHGIGIPRVGSASRSSTQQRRRSGWQAAPNRTGYPASRLRHTYTFRTRLR